MDMMSDKFNLPLRRECFPPDRAPRGRVPVGVRPFNCKTDSLSSRRTEKTRAILPIARILFLITSFLAVAIPPHVNQIQKRMNVECPSGEGMRKRRLNATKMIKRDMIETRAIQVKERSRVSIGHVCSGGERIGEERRERERRAGREEKRREKKTHK